MKTNFFVILLICLMSYFLTLNAETINQADNKLIVNVLNIKGTINPGSANYIESAIKNAENTKNVEALLVKLDTPGGLLSSTRNIIQYISESKIPVIIYVGPAGASATSAGAIISLGAHFVGMAPGSNIGAAHPVNATGNNIDGDMRKKIENDTSAMVRSLANLRGRNEQASIEIVTKSLSFSAEEAKAQGLIDVVANNEMELLAALDGKVVKVKDGLRKVNFKNVTLSNAEMTFGQKFLHLISDPNISYGLMALGGLGIYIEITTPGVILPGVIGIISLLLAFISLQTLPINYGGVALIAASLLMFIAEAFVSSYGALAVGGMISMVLGTIFLFDKGWANISVSLWILIPTTLAVATIVSFIGFLVIKRRKEFKKSKNQFLGYVGKVIEINENGKGRVQIRGEIWNFVSSEESEKLKIDDKVIVIDSSGFNLKVKKEA